MEKKSKILLGILAIVLIIFAGYMLAKHMDVLQTNANNEEMNKNEINEVVNQVLNEIKDEVQNSVGENVIQNKIDNTIENSTTNDTNNVETNGAQTGEEDRQKAIDMAKKEWGEDDSVSFKIDEQTEDGKFVVSVVDKNTTKVIFWYAVDVKNNTIEEK